MSAELIGILSVGVALGGLVLALQLRTDKRLDSFEERADRRMDRFVERMDRFVERMEMFEERMEMFEKRFVEELAGVRGELRALGERVARLEGLIEGSGLFRRAELSEAAGD